MSLLGGKSCLPTSGTIKHRLRQADGCATETFLIIRADEFYQICHSNILSNIFDICINSKKKKVHIFLFVTWSIKSLVIKFIKICDSCNNTLTTYFWIPAVRANMANQLAFIARADVAPTSSRLMSSSEAWHPQSHKIQAWNGEEWHPSARAQCMRLWSYFLGFKHWQWQGKTYFVKHYITLC